MVERATRDEWAARVARLKESGLSVAKFAAQIGVNAKTLAWWRAALARAEQKSRMVAASRRSRQVTIAPLNFIEMTARTEAGPVEVVLPSGVFVRVRAGFDAATFARVLDVMESRQR
jgi:transposase-like protein